MRIFAFAAFAALLMPPMPQMGTGESLGLRIGRAPRHRRAGGFERVARALRPDYRKSPANSRPDPRHST